MTEAIAATDTSKRPLVERRYDGKPKPPRTPHTHHLREFLLADGRRLLVDRRSIAFLCEAKEEEFKRPDVTIVAFKTPARACPVVEPYESLKAWWLGPEPVGNGNVAP